MSTPLSKLYIYPYHERSEHLALDWTNANELLINRDLFTPEQAHLFSIARKKQFGYAYGFKEGNYFDNIYPIIASGHPLGPRITFCGRKPEEWGGTGSCQKWRLCSRCAYIKQMKAWERYLPSYYGHYYLFVTISFNGQIRTPDTQAFAPILEVWRSIDSAIKNLKEADMIRGAYYVNELSITSFLPLTILPHTHCIFHVDPHASLPGAELFRFLSKCRENGSLPGSLTPSIRVNAVESERHFANVLQYPTKAIELAERYRKGISDAGGSVTQRIKLNREIEILLNGWITCTNRQAAIRRIGTMHPASSSYIGTTREGIHEARTIVRELLRHWSGL